MYSQHESPRFRIRLEPMGAARARFAGDLKTARQTADMLEQQNGDVKEDFGSVPPMDLARQDMAEAVLNRLRRFSARGEVPVQVGVVVFGRRFSREVGRRDRSQSSRQV